MKLSIPDALSAKKGKMSIDKLLLLLFAGVALVLLSFPDMEKKEEQTASENQTATISVSSDTYEKLLEERLTDILSSVEGVGRVQAMITLKGTEEKIVLTENPFTKNTSSEHDSEGGSRDTVELSQSETVVYIEGSDGSRIPYVIKEVEPEIEGIVVIAEGGDNIYIVKDITEAATALFGISSHKVKVMKMKTSS